MANFQEPDTAPEPDRWYTITLGSTFTESNPSKRFRSLRYEFKPASIDTSRPGTMHKSKENKVTVEFNNNQQGKPKLTFQGAGEDCKELDAVLFFDGESLTLERLHKSVKCLRHVRLPGESATVSALNAPEAPSPPPPRASKGGGFRPSFNTAVPVSIERIDVGEPPSSSPVEKKNGKSVDEMHTSSLHQPSPEQKVTPEQKSADENEHVDIDDEADEDVDVGDEGDIQVRLEGLNDGQAINVNIDEDVGNDPESDNESEDVDIGDDDHDGGINGTESLGAQLDVDDNEMQHSSSSSESSGSQSSGSASATSSSDTEGSDDDSAQSGHDNNS
eukprot:TRINITY_DN23719_c0_g1_i1.p1 TRINITY_DN23719_c0_g1~~TRINITY_DN23719_c0_g1_i1.p1  ORF type:complete len:332 (+),score=91.46 TRINITY_DN23719_c0_g1_i1:165-1160(+)